MHSSAEAAAAATRWNPPVYVSPLAHSTDNEQLAVDGRGNATAVWEQDVYGPDPAIVSAYRPALGSWQAPVILSRDGGRVWLERLALDVNAKGDAVVVWSQLTSGVLVMVSAMRPAGAAWQNPVQLSPDVETVEQARVAIDAQGAATAVWLAQRDGIFTVRSASRPPGQPWQAPVEVSAKDDHPYELRLAVNTRGDALALWRPDTTIAGPIHATWRPVGRDWQATQSIGSMASDPLVAMRPQGDAVMVWHEHVRSGESVIDGGLWTAELAPDGTSQARVAVGLAPDTSAWDIAVEASGVANVTLQAPATYVQPDGGTSSSFVVQVARWTAGDGLHSPVTLSSPGPTVFNPTIAITGRGDAAAVWGQTRTVCSRCDGDSRVLAAVRPVGSSWEAPVELAPSHGYVPGVVAGGDGPAIAFWRQGPILDTAAWVSPRAPVALQRFTAPAITGLRASPSRLRPARAGPPTRAAATTTGTLVTYRLSAAARVRFRVERARGGRRVGRSCVAATRGNRHAALCERFVTMPGAFTRARPAGRDRFRFTGRLTARAIKPGRYRLAATATAGGRRGTAKHALLRIVG